MLSTVFTYILDKIGAINAAVHLGLYFMPVNYILPSVFIITSLFAITIGSSMGAIAAFLPIALHIGNSASIPGALLSSAVVSGAMFGDNLSILSDTTISAVKITKANMHEKFKLNAKIALPAFVFTIIALFLGNQCYCSTTTATVAHALNSSEFILLIPYALVFGLAVYGMDILIGLGTGIIAATAIGYGMDLFTLEESISFIFNGFYESKPMVQVFVLVIFLSGLSKTIAYNGGLAYILEKTEKMVSKKIYAKFAIFILVSLVNAAIAINTIAIVVTGEIAKRLGAKHKIEKAEVATILDIGACVSQGLLPYTPQILLASSMAGVSVLSILPHLWYQYFYSSHSLDIFYTKETKKAIRLGNIDI